MIHAGTFHTVARLASSACAGTTAGDKMLAFLLAGLSVMGHHRARLRRWFLARISGHAAGGDVTLRLRISGANTVFHMREANEADYLIGGELVRGAYEVPGSDFVPSHIVDGGANIGMFALLAKRHFPLASLTCYEPDSKNVLQLKKNLAANGLEADVQQRALWSHTCTLYFHARSSYDGYVDECPPGSPIEASLPNVPDGSWLKLDIEGAEYEVLPALLECGARPGLISMELHHFDTKGGLLVDLLRKQGFEVIDDHGVGDCAVLTARRRSIH